MIVVQFHSLTIEKVEVALGVTCAHHYLEVTNMRKDDTGHFVCDFRCQVCGVVALPSPAGMA